VRDHAALWCSGRATAPLLHRWIGGAPEVVRENRSEVPDDT
jgi:hypothetical protein